jgi:hypothetical protein
VGIVAADSDGKCILAPCVRQVSVQVAGQHIRCRCEPKQTGHWQRCGNAVRQYCLILPTTTRYFIFVAACTCSSLLAQQVHKHSHTCSTKWQVLRPSKGVYRPAYYASDAPSEAHLYTMQLAAEAIRGQMSAHSLATGPAMAEPALPLKRSAHSNLPLLRHSYASILS